MLDYLHELVGAREQVCLIWGDQDNRAPAEVLETYRDLAAHMENVEVRIFPRVLNGYMIRGSPSAFHRATHDFSIKRARKILICTIATAVEKDIVIATPRYARLFCIIL
jgi:carboxymethylenebutenolidase